MRRPLRINRADSLYHVTARGNEQRDLFRDPQDRLRLLELLAELSASYGIRIHSHVLMDNHSHLLLGRKRGGMKWKRIATKLGGWMTQQWVTPANALRKP
jgi:putative transposase